MSDSTDSQSQATGSQSNDAKSQRTLEHLSVACRSLDGKEATGTVTITYLTPTERFKLALKRLGIFWLIAVLFIPVPAFHFVFVPLFLIIGVVAFYLGLVASSKRIAGGQGVCPSCQSPLQFPTRAFTQSFKEVCPSCRHEVRISLLS